MPAFVTPVMDYRNDFSPAFPYRHGAMLVAETEGELEAAASALVLPPEWRDKGKGGLFFYHLTLDKRRLAVNQGLGQTVLTTAEVRRLTAAWHADQYELRARGQAELAARKANPPPAPDPAAVRALVKNAFVRSEVRPPARSNVPHTVYETRKPVSRTPLIPREVAAKVLGRSR